MAYSCSHSRYMFLSAFSAEVNYHDTSLSKWLIDRGLDRRSRLQFYPDTYFYFMCSASQILHYMNQFRIMSLVNSWVARLLCLPPYVPPVRLGGVKGEPL